MTRIAKPRPKENPRKREEVKGERDFSQVVVDQVMQKLGEPPNFFRCTAQKVSEYAYRVNVWVKEGFSGQVTESYFLKVDDEGVILSPEINRKWECSS